MHGKRLSSLRVSIGSLAYWVALLIESLSTNRRLRYTSCARTIGYVEVLVDLACALIHFAGIGKPEVLRKAGIELLIDLPGVGENLQVSIHSRVVVARDGEWVLSRIMPAFLRSWRSRIHSSHMVYIS